IPADTQKHLDLRAGADKGRLYRVCPINAALRPAPRMDNLSPTQLVEMLDSANGWQRDTAQRLLVAAADPSVASDLARLSRNSSRAKVRLQALCTLDGLGQLDPAVLAQATQDSDARVREQAVRLSENYLRESPTPGDKAAEMQRALLQARLLALTK